MNYDPEGVKRYYNNFAEREWQRLVASPFEEVKLFIHRHYLKEHVPSGSRVLEIGAGPGRFTQQLHELGCRVVVSDISEAQLQLNKEKAQEHGFSASVEAWRLLDVTDLSALDSESFDVVLAYGGPLSYTFEKTDDALRHCRRVLKSDGLLIASVMSLWGSLHRFLEAFEMISVEHNRDVIRTGDLTPENNPGSSGHYCHMFRADELQSVLERNNFAVSVMSASNALSTNKDELLERMQPNQEQWSGLLEFELKACAQPGFVDGGTHIITVARKA